MRKPPQEAERPGQRFEQEPRPFTDQGEVGPHRGQGIAGQALGDHHPQIARGACYGQTIVHDASLP